MKYLPLLVLLLAVPALAEPTLEHEGLTEPEVLASPAPTHSPDQSATPAPTPTPMPPMCDTVNPSLTRCLAVQDPAAVLNKRVTDLEQRDGQIIQALQQVAQKVDAITPKPTPGKEAKK